MSAVALKRQRIQQDVDMVHAFLKKQKKPMSASEIGDKLGIKSSRISGALLSMNTQGTLIKSKRDVKDKCFVWEIKRAKIVQQRQAPHVSTNQPNGDLAYWQAFERNRLTPARLELNT